MIKRFFSLPVFAIMVLLFSGELKAADFSIENLRCEYLSNPLGIDVLAPRLSWEISSSQRGVLQTAYRVIVASSLELLKADSGDIWNSGKILSDSSNGISYKGRSLKSGMDYYWKVKIWTNKGSVVNSKSALWSMGLLRLADWNARWIGLDSAFLWEKPHDSHTKLSARYFRKEFNAGGKIKKAIVYVSGLGIYRLFIDGKKIGDGELSPGPTQYNKRMFYNAFDVKDAIKRARNAIGVILGSGRFYALRWHNVPPVMNFGYPKMLLQLEITYEDGHIERVVSDSTWKVTAHGPVVANNEYDGEIYNALLEMPGWSRPRFDASSWLDAQLVAAPGGELKAQMSPLIKIMDTVMAKSVVRITSGKFIIDMGQNMVGWVHLRINNGKPGDTVTMRFGERINSDGTLYTANLRSAEQTDHYIMKKGSQHWEPHFTYHGFRYIEISGYPGIPTKSDFVGKVVYDDLPVIGHFESSNKVINAVYHNAYWGIRGNYRGMPTDCPQRDERLGWQGDRSVGSYGESFIFDNNTFYAKWLQDIEDAQNSKGSIPDVVPTYVGVYSDNMTWPASYLIIANMLYHQFGNIKPIEQHYASMKRWLEYMKNNYMNDYIVNKDSYGDWCVPAEKPELIHSQLPERITAGDYLATAFYYRMLQLMEHFAGLLDKPEDGKAFAALGDHIKEAFNKKYLNVTNKSYSNNTATADILALAYRLAPDSVRGAVFQHIVNTTMNNFNGHVSTGLVGLQWLMRTLTHGGRPDIAYKLATNETYPSWGYMVREGATTIWELWNGNTANPAMNSGNHVMLLGDLIVWAYEDIAGIKSDPKRPGFRKIVMNPCPVEGLSYVKASYHSPYGLIESHWIMDKGSFDWQIKVPPNTTAEVFIPAKRVSEITEGGVGIGKATGVKLIRMEEGKAVLELGSGNYHFVSRRI